jgi:hypothetical protein
MAPTTCIEMAQTRFAGALALDGLLGCFGKSASRREIIGARISPLNSG